MLRISPSNALHEFTYRWLMGHEKTPFDVAMYGMCRKAKIETSCHIDLLLDLINRKRGFQAACLLINAPRESAIYMALRQRGRLDLTVEALVVESLEWRKLFTPEEIARAERRLAASHYTPKEPT